MKTKETVLVFAYSIKKKRDYQFQWRTTTENKKWPEKKRMYSNILIEFELRVCWYTRAPAFNTPK